MKIQKFARLTAFAAAFAGLILVCGCDQSAGNSPETKKETVAPQSSMEAAYKSGGAPGRSAQK
jgi:hypothetical protein